DAEAYAIKAKAEADAEQTRVVAQAILDNGQPAVDFEIMKRQVEGLTAIAAAENSKTVIVPSDITRAIGSLQVLIEGVTGREHS
ncbi:MAG: SPFH/Band 7/PHB domain protein, partial [Myxococcota bacterium]|nr:SPFH/Band 7/PHB domain protein [Myxococcota bacterium]